MYRERFEVVSGTTGGRACDDEVGVVWMPSSLSRRSSRWRLTGTNGLRLSALLLTRFPLLLLLLLNADAAESAGLSMAVCLTLWTDEMHSRQAVRARDGIMRAAQKDTNAAFTGETLIKHGVT